MWVWFVLGGAMFWITGIIFCIAMTIAVEIAESQDDGDGIGFAVFFMAIYAALLLLFTDAGSYCAAHPILCSVGLLATYIVGGVLWATPKWICVLVGLIRTASKIRDNFFEQHDITSITDSALGREFAGAISNNRKLYSYGVRYNIEEGKIEPPKIAKNRTRILIWMCFWPWDAFWTIFKDPIRWIFEAVFDWLKLAWQNIADKMFSGFSDIGPGTNPKQPKAVDSEEK